MLSPARRAAGWRGRTHASHPPTPAPGVHSTEPEGQPGRTDPARRASEPRPGATPAASPPHGLRKAHAAPRRRCEAASKAGSPAPPRLSRAHSTGTSQLGGRRPAPRGATSGRSRRRADPQLYGWARTAHAPGGGDLTAARPRSCPQPGAGPAPLQRGAWERGQTLGPVCRFLTWMSENTSRESALGRGRF